MRTSILGKVVEEVYLLNEYQKEIMVDGCKKTVFTCKPGIEKEDKVKWEEIVSYEGEPMFNSRKWRELKQDILFDRYECRDSLNISENEEVHIENRIFRADLNTMMLYSDKVISTKEVNKEESEKKCTELTKLFNKEMIESDEKLKDHCDLYNLNYEDTDVEKLFNEVYPAELKVVMNIVDGKISIKKVDALIVTDSGKRFVPWVN